MGKITIQEMDEALKNMSEVRGIRIKAKIPKELKEMKQLEVMFFNGQTIKNLPKWLPELKYLRCIRLEGVNDNFFTEENCKILAEISSLEELSVGETLLSSWIYYVTQLKFLSAAGQRQPIQEIFKLTNLLRLEITNNYLPVLPSGILALTKLEHLSIKGSQMREISEEIIKLPHLKYLNVSFNDLRKLPKSIDQMRNLEELVLVGIGLGDIPKVMQNIPKLSTLDISSNPIRKVSEPILRMKELKNFRAANCDINQFPDMLLNMSKLIALDMSRNDMGASIPDLSWKKNLKSLSLSSCHLKEFPKGVTELKELELLDLSDNAIEVLPSSIEKLVNLKKLLLSGTSIQSLPQELTSLSRLQRLELNESKVSFEEVRQLLTTLPDCSSNIELTPKEKKLPWLVQMVAYGLLGKKQKKYKTKNFAMIIYDVDEESGYSIMTSAETLYELIMQTSEIMDLEAEEQPEEWEAFHELTETIKSNANPKVLALLHYLDHHFDFFLDTDDYESDSYFDELHEAMPKSEFIAGWSAQSPYQDEAYAIVLLPKKECI